MKFTVKPDFISLSFGVKPNGKPWTRKRLLEVMKMIKLRREFEFIS